MNVTAEGLVPFTKLMQIQKIMQPRMDSTHLDRRRDLYKKQDWKRYEQCMKQELDRGVQVAQAGYQALNSVTGLTQSVLHRSTGTYSLDFDKRDIMQEFMQKAGPSGGKLRTNRILSKEETLEAVKFLQSQQVESYTEALRQVPDRKAPGAQDQLQLKVHTQMAKSRDKLFIEQGIGEHDIEQAIRRLDLETDSDFAAIMR